MLCVTNVTRMAYVHHARAMYQGKGFLSEGPAGTGKTETCKDFNRLCGRSTLVVNCSDQLTAEIMIKLMVAARKSGWSLGFDEFNRILPEHLVAILEGFKKEFLGHQRGACCTLNPGYAGRAKLPQAYYLDFDRMAFTVPDFDIIC